MNGTIGCWRHEAVVTSSNDIRKLIRLSNKLEESSKEIEEALKKEDCYITRKGYKEFIEEISYYYPYDYVRVIDTGIEIIVWNEVMKETLNLIQLINKEGSETVLSQKFRSYEILLREIIGTLEKILKTVKQDLVKVPISQ